jgi:hypothetical protein
MYVGIFIDLEFFIITTFSTNDDCGNHSDDCGNHSRNQSNDNYHSIWADHNHSAISGQDSFIIYYNVHNNYNNDR